MKSIFETERLIARHWSPSTDVESAFEIYGDPDVMRYLGRSPEVVPCLDEQKARLEKIELAMLSKQNSTGMWAIMTKNDQEVIGSILFKELPDADNNPTGDFEIGWHLAKRAWGNGYATEAAEAIIQYAFKTMPILEVLHAVAYDENLKSLAVMKRIGMKDQGTTTKYYGISCRHFTLHKNQLQNSTHSLEQ